MNKRLIRLTAVILCMILVCSPVHDWDRLSVLAEAGGETLNSNMTGESGSGQLNMSVSGDDAAGGEVSGGTGDGAAGGLGSDGIHSGEAGDQTPDGGDTAPGENTGSGTVSGGDAGSDAADSVSDNDAAGSVSDNDILGNGVSSGDLLMMSFALQGYDPHNIPLDSAEYQAGKSFVIKYPNDFLILQALSAETDFAGVSFQIASPAGGGTVWELDKIGGFTGIGTMVHPFKGSMAGYYDTGITFRFTTALFAWLGDGAQISQLDIACQQAATAAIALQVADNASVSLQNITLGGTVYSSFGPAAAIAGTVGRNAVLTLQNIKANNLVIMGGQAGGLAGVMQQGAGISIAAFPQTVQLSGSVTGTECVGGLFGKSYTDYTYLTENTSLAGNMTVFGSGEGAHAGTLIGKLAGTAKLNISGGGTIAAVVAGSGTSGGVVGGMLDNSVLTADKGIHITGTISGYRAGGIVGQLSSAEEQNVSITGGACSVGGDISGQSAEAGGFAAILDNTSAAWRPNIPDGITVTGNVTGTGDTGGLAGNMSKKAVLPGITVSGRITGGLQAGGVLGTLKGSSYALFGDVKITGTINGVQSSGAAIGRVETKSCAELGRTDMSGATIQGSQVYGKVVGRQEEALVYVGSAGSLLLNTQDLDEAGVGGIFRNPTVGGGVLIGDGTLEKCGVINTAVAKSGDSYVFKTAADFISFAIALNSQGNFGREAFGNADIAALLSARILVQPGGNSVDISYDKTGIVTLNRNDVTDGSRAFTGSVTGTDAATTIVRNVLIRQARIGLFSTIGTGASFENLTLQGKLERASGAGSIAYRTVGSSLKLTNVTNQMTFTELKDTGAVYGGFVAVAEESITVTARKLVLAGAIEGEQGSNFSGFLTNIVKGAVMDMDDITVSVALSSKAWNRVGGFLGCTWNGTGGKIQNVTVDGASLACISSFGGLVYQVTTATTNGQRLILQNINYKSVEVTRPSNGNGDCAMLISDATNLVLEVVDYEITAGGCRISNITNNFDDIVSKTNASNPGGVVSLKSSKGKFPTWHYEQVVGQTNSNARYYYNLFDTWEKTPSALGEVTAANVADSAKIAASTLDTPEKVLLWSTYMSASPAGKNYLKNYMAASLTESDITFKGTLDMSNYSVYPVPPIWWGTFKGTDSAKLIWHVPDWAKSMGTNGQHARLHAGLFSFVNNVTISGLTLSGRVMNLGNSSGALVCGSVQAAATITDIILEDLWLEGYVPQQQPVGLMISNIPTGTVYISGISMVYPANAADKAATSLIGSAGSADEKALILEFQRMKIADEKTGGVKHNGSVLSFASFLFNYNYTDDVVNNKGRGLYLFTQAEADAKQVTWGSELDSATEYRDNTLKVEADQGISHTNYIPYVYQSKQIEINPKTGDITKGCGTYEDPYIIVNAKQFLTLYRYINETGTVNKYQYQSFYEGWKIPAIGDDRTFCTQTNHAALTFTKDSMPTGFPSPDQLCKAYFKLGDDIDLSVVKLDNTYKIIAEEFVGFGTQARPFKGVLVGSRSGGGQYSITLPEKQSAMASTAYGLFGYVKGAVVKDVAVKSTDIGKSPVVNSMGSAVFGCVLGGDNIIDNVTIDTRIKANANAVNIGGYAGAVKKGSLILRNVGSGSVAGFQVYTADGTRISAEQSGTYLRTGQVVGMVEDGFVLYEGSADASAPLWSAAAGYPLGSAYLPVSPSFGIINGKWLLDNTAGQLSVVKDNTNKTITVTLPNTAALYLMAIGLNSDSLNVGLNGSIINSNYAVNGYNSSSICRKAAYDMVGSCTAGTPDYIAAAKYDNADSYGANNYNDVAAYPYLYNYFGITGDQYKEYKENNQTLWNTHDSVWRTTYQLAAGGTYDLSAFGNSFRGIGALYAKGTEGYGGVFRANFDGQGSTIHLNMVRDAILFIGSEDTQAGLFNRLAAYSDTVQNIATPYTIQNVKITGVVSAPGLNINCGGIAGEIGKGRFAFENVDILAGTRIGNAADTEKNTAGYAGGLIGRMLSSGDTSIKNCTVGADGTADKRVIISGTNAGGFVGYMNNGSNKLAVNITGGKVAYTTLPMEAAPTAANKGGLIGFADNGSSKVGLVIEGTDTAPLTVQNCEISNSNKGTSTAGGIGGWIKCHIEMRNVLVDTVTVNAYSDAGGLFGQLSNNTSANNEISDTKVTGSTIRVSYGGDAEGSGGAIGKSQIPIAMRNITIEKNIIEINSKQNFNKNAGGLVGSCFKGDLTADGIQITENIITAKGNQSGTNVDNEAYAGGAIGYLTAGNDTLSRINIRDNDIQAVSITTTPSRTAAAGGLVGCLDTGASLTMQYFAVEGSAAGKAQIIGDYNAGGAIGILCGAAEVKPVSASAGENEIEKYNRVRNISIGRGTNAGGFIGQVSMTNSGKSAVLWDVTVDNAFIVSRDGLAGGFLGQAYSYSSGTLYCYNTTVQNSRIQSAMTGIFSDGAHAAGGLAGSIEGNLISFWDHPLTLNVSVGIAAGTDSGQTLKLLDSEGRLTGMPSDVTEANVSQYAVHVGNMAGMLGQSYSGQTYMLYPVFTPDTGAAVRPAVDVGRKLSEGVYNYRSNCHIIYETAFSGTKGMNERHDSYLATKDGPGKGFLDAYRLDADISKVFQNSYWQQGTYAPPGTDIAFPQDMIVYSAENGTMQEVIGDMLDIMTNVSGAPSPQDAILTVKAAAKWIELSTGQITDNTGAASILTGKQGSLSTFTYNKYDICQNGKASFTELTFHYEWEKNNVKTSYECRLPVFVQEILEIDVYNRIDEGAKFDTGQLQNSQYGNILMANNSNYTIYTEYLYSSARMHQENLRLQKEFYLMEEVPDGGGVIQKKKVIPEGTRLTLVDVTDGNKVYYYEVPSANVTNIPYTAFKDSAGNSWTARKIGGNVLPNVTTPGQAEGTYIALDGTIKANVGREQYVMVLQKPEGAYYPKEVYTIHADPFTTDASAAKKMVVNSNNVLNVSSIPGLKISIVRTGDDATYIKGEISRQGTLSEKLVYSLVADPVYWTEKSGGAGLIDSQNHNKYLEAGMYLRDTNNRVRFPAGTNIRYKTGEGAFSDWSGLNNTSIIYFYKDSGGMYQISDVNANVQVSLEIELNFALADLSTMTGSEYIAWIDLLRTSNKDYPMGTDPVIDSYYAEIPAATTQQLGFAVEADDKGDLAVNTYKNQETSKLIPFKTKYDFASILKSFGIGSPGEDKVAQTWSEKEYHVTYEILEKIRDNTSAGYHYEPYTGTHIKFQENDVNNTIHQPPYKTVYSFTRNEIKSGNVLERPLNIWIDSSIDDLSNFKIHAVLQVTDAGAVNTDSALTMDDFFIFTITRLKTDL